MDTTSNDLTSNYLQDPPKDRKARRRLIVTVIAAAVIAHMVFGGVAAVWIVAQYFQRPPATFEVKRELELPAKEREHKMDMQEAAALAPAPTLTEKIISLRPSDIPLPELPMVPLDDMLPLSPTEILSDQVNSLTSGDGTGGDGRGQGGKKPDLDAMEFFGIKDSGRSVVIMIDVSSSMFGRTGDYDYTTSRKLRVGKDQAFQKVRDEAIKLVEKLSISTRFGIVRWSGGAYSWQMELVPATAENKQAAIDHINNEVDVGTAGPKGGEPGGTRHDLALREVLQLKPEVVFMLSDGNATIAGGGGDDRNSRGNRNNRGGGGFGGLSTIPERDIVKVVEDGLAAMEEPARIHVIYYVTGKDQNSERSMLRAISRKSGGSFRMVRAEKKN